ETEHRPPQGEGVLERSARDVLDHVRRIGGAQQRAGLRYQVGVSLGVVHCLERRVRLTGRARPNEIELPKPSWAGQFESVGLDKLVAAVSGRALQVHTGHVEAGVLQAARRTA